MLFGVALPLPPDSFEFKLTALSLGAGGARGFRPPAAGLFAGGAGGVGLAFRAGLGAPFACETVMLGEGTGRAAAGGGGGGGGGAAARAGSCSST